MEREGWLFEIPNGTKIQVREAQEGDAAALLRFLQRNQPHYPYMISRVHEIETDSKWRKKWIKAHQLRANCLLLVAQEEGDVGGDLLGVLNFMGGSRERVLHDGEMGISVAYDHTGEGIGGCMMKTLLFWARNNPLVGRITLFVMGDNLGAIRFYRNFGFQVEGNRKQAVRMDDGTFQDLIMMGLFVARPLEETP